MSILDLQPLTALPDLLNMLSQDSAMQRIFGPQSTQGSIAEQNQKMQDILTELAKQAAQATAAVGPAQAALTQATNAPLPQPGPGDIIAQLGGDIGTAISGSPRFAARAEAGVGNRQAERLMQRQEQLNLLHDELARRSAAAIAAGNLDVATKIQVTLGRIGQLQDQAKARADALAAQAGVQAGERASQRTSLTNIEIEKMRAAVARYTADAASGRAAEKEGFNPDTGLMKRDFYVKERNKLMFLARNPKTDKAALRTSLIAHDINRLDGETPNDMANRLKRLRDPYDQNKYLISQAPVNKLLGIGGARATTPETASAIYDALSQAFTPEELAAAKFRDPQIAALVHGEATPTAQNGTISRAQFTSERQRALDIVKSGGSPDVARNTLRTANINRLPGETPEAMAQRLLALRDPYNNDISLISGLPMSSMDNARIVRETLRPFFSPQELDAARARTSRAPQRATPRQ